MNNQKSKVFYILIVLFFLLSSNCSEYRDNKILIRIICVNCDFNGTYDKNSNPSVDILDTNNTQVGNVWYQDIRLEKVNSLTVVITSLNDYTSPNDVRLMGYIIEDDVINDEAIQVDTTSGGSNASITLTLN